MRWIALILALTTVAAGCSSLSDGISAHAAPPIPGPAPWQGPLADRLNRAHVEPATPALRAFKGRTPLIHLRRVPAGDAPSEPGYEVAVFDDGTLVYEGHRCVRVGGLVLTRLGPDELAQVQDLVAALCVGFDRINEGELCEDAATLRLTCTNGPRAFTGSDRCRKDDLQGRRIEALRAGLLESLQMDAWVGEPTNRQACTRGARDMAPHELDRTIS